MAATRAPLTDSIPDVNFRDDPLTMVKTLYIRFIQGLFHAAPVGAYHWEPGESSEIVITDENPIKPEIIGVRPCISVTRGPVQFFSLGLDDMLSYNFQTGQKNKSVIVPGTVTINCCSRVDIECDRLAFIVAEQLWANREILMKLGFFEIGRQPSIGAPTPAGSIISGDNGDEWYVVSVTCPFQFTRTTSVTPLGAKIVQGINLSLQAALRATGGSCGVPSTPGAEYPTFSQGCPPASFAPDASDVGGHTPNPGFGAPVLPVVPHPLNPAQMVVVRSVRPACPAVRPPAIGGRSIPISTSVVEESCGKQTDAHVTDTSTVKV